MEVYVEGLGGKDWSNAVPTLPSGRLLGRLHETKIPNEMKLVSPIIVY